MAGLTPRRPLDAEDDTAAFDCGRDALNHWLRRHAWRNQQADVSCGLPDGSIATYVCLSAAPIERACFPKARQRHQLDPTPAVWLGQLAVDRRRQGRGVARSLTLFALTTGVRYSREVRCVCVMTHALNAGVREFYGLFGFEDLPFGTARSMAVRIADLMHEGIGAPGVEAGWR